MASVSLLFPMPDGPSATAYTFRYDYDANSCLIYFGWAYSSPVGPGSKTPASGPLSSASLWAIKKGTYDSQFRLILTQWANGSPSMTNIWDDRASLNYQ